MVVTIIEHGGRNWFFRMLGPSSEIDNEVRNFISFMHSVEFSNSPDSTPRFDHPPHWEPLPATGMRFAAFRFGNESDPIELTVVPLGPESGDLLANVNRWRDQLQLPPITEEHLPESAMTVTLGDREITLVDIVSGHHHAPMPGAAMAADDPHAGLHGDAHGAAAPISITYDVPTGWIDRGAAGMRQASLAVMENNEVIVDISVISLPGEAGGKLANVNFWREQLGLQAVDESRLAELMEPITIDGDKQAMAVDMVEDDLPELHDDQAPAVSPDSHIGSPSESSRQRILAVIHSHDDKTWFIKLTGPDTIVGQHRERFKQFVASIRFGDGDTP